MSNVISFNEVFRAEKSKGEFKRLTLCPKHMQAWEETRTAFLFACPAFSHIYYTMLVPDNKDARKLAFFTDQVPIAATDAYEIFLNPEPFFKMPLAQRIFVVAHEIIHPVEHHNEQMAICRATGRVVLSSGKVLPYDHQTANRAMDYQDNDLLISCNVGEPPPDICWDRNIGTYMDSWVDIYERIYQPPPPPPPGGSQGRPGDGPPQPGKPGSQWNDVMEPGTGQPQGPDGPPEPRGAGEWQVAVAGAIEAAKAQGKLPAALEKRFGAVVDPKVSWQEHIQAFLARKAGSGGYDFQTPDEQMICRGLGVLDGMDQIYAASRSGFGAGTIVVGNDSSGSIYADPSLIDRWMGELAGMLSDLRPRRIVVMWCDAEVKRVDEVEDACDLDIIRMKGAVGGGGTSFVPVFEEIKKMGLEPDCLVYLTDGDGKFPKEEPSYPVLWGNITKGYKEGKPYPFGEVVTIPLQ